MRTNDGQKKKEKNSKRDKVHKVRRRNPEKKKKTANANHPPNYGPRSTVSFQCSREKANIEKEREREREIPAPLS